MKKSVLITASIFSAMGVAIAVPPIVIAATTKPANKQIYNDALSNFFDICKIPHCSNEEGHMDSLVKIKNYIIKKASDSVGKNAVHSDKVGNVWVDIPASKKRKDSKKLVLQGHMDMVWATTGEAREWDKWTHPVSQPVIEEIDGVETIHSKDWLTNLGLDNGAAVALMLSLISNRNIFEHGQIRCIFTANEENGSPGSESLGQMEDGTTINVLDHKEGYDYLMNLDTGPIGDIVFNSGGGCLNTVSGTLNTSELTSQNIFTLRIYDAKGGHSGVDIGNGYSNPIGLALQAIQQINVKNDAQIVSFVAPGSTNSSIPTEAIVEFVCPTYASLEDIKTPIERFLDKQKRQKYTRDTDLKWSTTVETASPKALSSSTSKTIIDFISGLEFGALERYIDPEEYDAIRVSGNIGILSIDTSIDQNNFNLVYGNRFQETSYYDQYYREDTVNQFKQFANALSLNQKDEEWTSWEGQKDGKMCSIASKSYKSSGTKTRKIRCHGGLECADFMKFNDQLDIVSTGASVLAEHNVRESMSLPSYKQLINMLLWATYDMKF